MTETRAGRFRRASIVRIYDVDDRIVLVGADDSARELSGDSAALARSVLSFARAACSRDELLAHLEEQTGGPLGDGGVRIVDELVEVLFERGAVTAAGEPDDPPRTAKRHGTARRLVLCLSGAVAAMHAPSLVLLFQRHGFDVRVAATESALRFVRAEALEALLHTRVSTHPFDIQPGLAVPHIDLARWADVVVVWPASGTTVSRLATGDYSSLVAAIALTARVPVVVVPSMNAAMLASPATRRNLEQLAEDGMHVVHPAAGIEVADPPGERHPNLGPAPPHAVVVQLVETILAAARRRRGPRLPQSADEWEQIHRDHSPRDLPWYADQLDADIAQILSSAPTPVAILDIGTGHGLVAIAAARRGHRVVATDISATAIERARAGAEGQPIVWLEDDISESRLHGAFDIAIDRGCLHLLPDSRVAGYAAAVGRLVAPSGTLVLKTHTEAEAPARGTIGYTRDRVVELLGAAFELVSEARSEFPAAASSSAAAARLFVLRRT